jgi:Fic family protein
MRGERMSFLPDDIRRRIDDKLARLNALRPLPAAALLKLRERFGIEMTYNSNAIEGNSLTLKETFLVVNEGLTIKGKPLRDHLEAKGHNEALDFLYELLEKGSRFTMSERLIRELNQIVMRDIDREWAGRYRSSDVFIGGASHTPPAAVEVPQLMESLVKWAVLQRKRLHVVELAAVLHHRLVHVHPFFDGNGRTARLAMNIILMKNGFPMTLILKNDRKKYYRTLEAADKGDIGPFVRFIAQAVERSLDIYLKALVPVKKAGADFISLSDLAKGSKFSEKYLNLLAGSGRLEAHKEGRNWLSSNDALKRYLDGRKRKRG